MSQRDSPQATEKVASLNASFDAEGGFCRQATDLGLSKSAVDFHRQEKIIQELFCECNNYFQRFWQEITREYEILSWRAEAAGAFITYPKQRGRFGESAKLLGRYCVASVLQF